jgi:gas vesicle protein
MSLDEVISGFMKKLELKDDEVKVYLTVLGAGRLAIGDVSFSTGLSVDVCKSVLDRLVELRFVRRVPGEVEGFVALNPFLAGFLIVYEDLTNLFEDLRKVADSRYQELSEGLDKSKTLSVEELSRVTRERVEIFKSFVEDFSNLMGSKFGESADSFRGLSVSVEEAIHSLLSTGMVSMSDVEHFQEKKGYSLLDITSEFISNLDQDVASLEGLTGKMLSAFIKEIHSRFELIKLQFVSILAEHRSRHEKNNSELDNKIRVIIDTDLSILRSSIDEIESSILDIIKIILDITDKKLGTFKNEYLETLNGLRNQYLDVLTSFEPRVKSIIEGLENASLDLARSTTSLGSRKRAFASVVFKGDAYLEELKEQTKSINEMIKGLNIDYHKVLSDQFVSVNEITERITKNLSTFIDEKTNSIKVDMSSVEQKVKEHISPKLPLLGTKITDRFSEAIRANNDDCEKVFASLEQEMGSYVDNAFKNFNEALSSFEGGSKELFSTYKNNIRNRIKLLEYNVLYLRKKIAQMLQINAFEYDKMIDELYDNLTNSIKQKTEPYIEELGPFEEKIASVITKNYTESKEILDKNIRDLINKSSGIISHVGKREEILKGIWEASYKFFIPNAKTWSLTGEKAIIAHTKSMTKRTKKNIMIISPELIPEVLEELLNVKDFKATIASNIDKRVFESVIKHFSRQGKVKFLNYSNKDLWCVIRDKDEILFAPVTNKEEIVAVVSEQQGYIKFNLETIMPMVLSKSKEIKIG